MFAFVGVCREVSAALPDNPVPSAFAAKPQGHTAGLSVTTRGTRVSTLPTLHMNPSQTLLYEQAMRMPIHEPTIYMILKNILKSDLLLVARTIFAA